MAKNIQTQLDDLRAKKHLSGADRAKIKVLERELKLATQKSTIQDKQPQTNIFATTPTTKIHPLPIRFSKCERIGLTQLANEIKTHELELIISELGSEREINDTKLVRAAVYLLKQQNHEEIVAAIKQVKLNMIR